jgi:hypothetical protein
MCGIVGVVHKAHNGFDKKNEAVFYEMLYCDALRGDDSTGVILVENTSGFGIMKEGYSSAYVVDAVATSDQGKAMFSRGKAMIGHNRKKTIGEATDENAHPFVVNDEFAMVHNGTLTNHKALADTAVDSEALAIHLEPVLNCEDWNLENFEAAIGKVYGAYAIAAYSQKNHSVYLLRNDQRPLSYVETPDGFYWASEMGLLYWILGRNGIALQKCQPVVVKENSIYRIDLDTNKVEVISYIPKKATPVAHTVTGTSKNTSYKAATSGGTKRLSKNAFKAIKKRWFGTQTDFWADDFIEKDYPKTIAQGASDVLLIGEIDEMSFDHVVHGEFDLNELHPKEKFLNCLYLGRITEMEYDKRTGMVEITLGELAKVTPSRTLKHEDIPALH